MLPIYSLYHFSYFDKHQNPSWVVYAYAVLYDFNSIFFSHGTCQIKIEEKLKISYVNTKLAARRTPTGIYHRIPQLNKHLN